MPCVLLGPTKSATYSTYYHLSVRMYKQEPRSHEFTIHPQYGTENLLDTEKSVISRENNSSSQSKIQNNLFISANTLDFWESSCCPIAKRIFVISYVEIRRRYLINT